MVEIVTVVGCFSSPFAEQKPGSGAASESPILFQRSVNMCASKLGRPERFFC